MAGKVLGNVIEGTAPKGKVMGNVLQGTAPKGKVVGNVAAGAAPVATAVGDAVRQAAAIQPPAESAGLYGAFAKRGAEVGSNLLQFFDTIGREPIMPAWIYEQAGQPLPERAPPGSTWLGQAGDYLGGLADSVNFQPRAPFESIGPAFENEGVWGGLGTLGRFLLEQGATSVPDMAAAIGAPVAYGASLTQEIGEERAANNQSGDVTVGDLFAAAPAAAVSAFLDRYGGMGILKGVGAKTPIGRVLGAGAREAWTEFLQEQAQYAGETVGTEKGFDPQESLMRGAAGALGGAGLGGAGRGAVELAQAVTPGAKDTAPAAPPPSMPAPAPQTKQQAAAAAQVPLGQTVGLKTANARGGFKVINATPERVEGGVVFWRDEDGNMNTDAVEDFVRDTTAAAPPKKAPVPEPPPEVAAAPVVSDPLEGAEPDRAPMRQQRAAPLLGEPAVQMPVTQPRPRRDTVDPLAETIRREQMAVSLWDGNIAKAQAAIDRGDPSAKAPEDVAYMLQAREDAAGRLAAALRQRDQGAAARGAEAEQATQRVREQQQGRNIAAQEAQAAEAEAAMQRVQTMPRPAPEAEAPRLAPLPPKPQGLVAWIAGRGGMRDPTGELRAMDLQRRPGFIRKTRAPEGTLLGGRRAVDQLDPDYVREAAVEAGYLPEGATVNDLYDAIGADLRGERQVAEADLGDELERQDAARQAAEIDQFENMYGTDPALAELRFDADRLGMGWDSDATTEDLRASIDERLALMDIASIEEAEAALQAAEDRAAEIMQEEWDADAESESAVEDRAAETEDGQAGREVAEGDLEAPGEPGTEGVAVDDREDRGSGEEAVEAVPVLESRRGAGDIGAEPGRRRPAPGRQGRDQINRSVQNERWKTRRANEKRGAEGRSDAVAQITADEEAEVQAFTRFLGDKLLEGVSLDIVAGEPDQSVAGNFDPATNVVTVFRSAVERGYFTRTMMHELWHAMESVVTGDARAAVISEWRRNAERYIRRNPWMEAFANREIDGPLSFLSSSLPVDESQPFIDSREGRDAIAMGRVVVKPRPDGQPQVWVNWDGENYRFLNASEFFAETMTERYEAMADGADAFTRSVFEFLRAIWQRIVAGLRSLYGGDVMGSVFNGFRDGAITVPDRPLPPIYEDVLEGTTLYNVLTEATAPQPVNRARQELLTSAAAIPDPGQAPAKPAFVLGKWFAMFKQASWISRKDANFAKLNEALLDEHYLETKLIRDGGDAMNKLLNLSRDQQKTAHRLFEVARLAGIPLTRTGRRIVVQVPQIGVGGMTVDPALSKPGDVIQADQKTTEAVLDVANWLQSKWYEMWGSIAAANGYKGEFTQPGIAQAKADAAARGSKADQRFVEFVEELYTTAQQNERDGYIPFMRYGDTALIVKEKNPQPGANPVAAMVMVDTNKGLGAVISGYKRNKRLDAARRELEAKYPASSYTIEERAMGEQELDALDLPMMDKLMIAARLDKPAAAINVYRSLINMGTSAEQKMFKDIAGSLPEAARRKIIDDIKSGMLRRSRNVPGYETDFTRALLDYNRSSAGIVAKRMLRSRVEDGKQAVFGNRETGRDGSHESVRKWTERWLNYIDQPESDWWRAGRFLGFYMNMFGSISSALVNTFSTITVTMPQMMAWSNTGPADVLFAMQYGMRGIAGSMKRGAFIDPKRLGLKGPLRDAVIEAEKTGLLSPSLAADLYGKEEARFELGRRGGKAVQAYLEIGSSLFNYAEQANRFIAFIAAYKAAQNGKNRARFARMYAKNARVQEMIAQHGLTPETIARFMVENTQFIGGQIDRSAALRNFGGIALQFKQYALNYIRLLRENFAGQGMRGKMVGLAMLGSMFYFGGLLAVPGVEDIMVLMETIYWTMTGGETWDIESALREFFMETMEMDELGAEQMMRGSSREQLGVDLSSRIGIGRLTPEFGDPFQAIPLFAATVGRFNEAVMRYGRGETAGGTVALLSPLLGKGISDALRGFWVYDTEGYITKTGTQKFAPHELTWGEKAMQAMGLRPTRLARALEYDYAQRRIANQMSTPKAALMDQLANAGYNAERAREAGDEDAALEFEAEMLRAWDEAWEAYADPSTPPERLIKPPEWRDVMRAIQDRMSEYSRIKRAPKLAREAMEAVPYVRE